MKVNENSYLNTQAKKIRNLTIETIGKFGVGHLGGSVSIAEALSAIYFDAANVDPKNPKWQDRDRIVLSKGHAGSALYCALALKGYFDISLLDTLNRNGTTLPSHCDMNKTTGVDMTAGSLGQGLSAAVGMALAGKIDKKDYTVYCIIGDGECQEGQIWEASMFAASRKLDNLIVLLDNNKMQIDGLTKDINNIEPLDEKFKSFGFNVYSVYGHDADLIAKTIKKAKKVSGKPTVIILDTVKGKGVHFCEGQVSSHSITMTEEMWKSAIKE